MKSKLVLLVLVFLLCCTVFANAELSIVCTDFPCYDLTRQVAGDACSIEMLIQPGMEVHSFEPTPADIQNLNASDCFIYIGGESDAWADTILEGLTENAPQVLKLMYSVEPILEESTEESPEYDEHIWTSPKNAMLMVEAIAGKLIELDPDNAELYRANADAEISAIAEIDSDIETLVASAVRKKLIFADRFPFIYLVNAYGLEYDAAFASCTADTEVSPQVLMRLINAVEEEAIPVIYTIEMSTQNIGKVVAESTGAEILTLHSVQTVSQDEFDGGETYVSLMRKNVEALEKGLN